MENTYMGFSLMGWAILGVAVVIIGAYAMLRKYKKRP